MSVPRSLPCRTTWRPRPARPPGSTGPATTTRSASSTPTGQQIQRFTVAHTTGRAGCADPSAAPRRRQPRSGSNAPTARSSTRLLAAGLTVVVIAPGQLKNLRSRYGSAGNKDDRFDAYVLADVLRTDRHRLRPLHPRHPGDHRAAGHRAAPARTWSATGSRWPTSSAPTCRLAFPGAVGLFDDIDSPDQPAVPDPLPQPAGRRLAVAQAPGRLACRRQLLRPQDPHPAACPPDQRPPRPHRPRRRRPRPHHPRAAGRHRHHRHPDRRPGGPHRASSSSSTPTRDIFRSLPRSGTVRAARLLAEIGDCPRPVPHPRIAGLPGRRRPLHPPVRQATARSPSAGPPTRSSATRSATSPATAATPTPGPPTSTSEPSSRGHDHPHAVRILARAWLRHHLALLARPPALRPRPSTAHSNPHQQPNQQAA